MSLDVKIQQTDVRLVLRDIPRASWVFGTIFIMTGLLVLSVPLWAREWPSFGVWERLAVITVGLGHFVGGVYTVSQSAMTRTEFNRTSGVGTQLVTGLWPFVRRSETHFPLDQVRKLEVVRSKDNDGDSTFRLRLWLADSRTLWLQAQATYREDRTREHADRILSFLHTGSPHD